jgi:hypothetical protein
MAVASASNPALGNVTLGLSNVAIFAQSGAPTGKVAREGSIYIRTDGSISTAIVFVNTDGDSTWLGVGAPL